MGSSLASVISAFEAHAGSSAANIAALILWVMTALFFIWTAFQLLGYFKAWFKGNSDFFEMTMYMIRNMILLVIVVAFILQ